MTVTPLVRVQAEPFDIAAQTAMIGAGNADIGAVVSFIGLCRGEQGRLSALELQHYAGMAEAEIGRIAERACDRWPLDALTVIHRHGRIAPGEAIVLVLAASAHRDAAFEAARFMMDYLKTDAPFWKREHLADGTTGDWIDADDADMAASRRWLNDAPGV